MPDQPNDNPTDTLLSAWATDILATAEKHGLLPMDGLYVYALAGENAIVIHANFTTDDAGQCVSMVEVRAGAAEVLLSTQEGTGQ